MRDRSLILHFRILEMWVYNADDLESRQIFCKGLVVREPITSSSNFRSSGSFKDWLVANRVVGICGVDTRSVTRNVRNKGPRQALIYSGELGELIDIDKLIQKIDDRPHYLGMDLAAQVSVVDPLLLGVRESMS